MKTPSLQSISETATILLCCGLLAVPFLGTFIGFDLYPQEGENRALATFPDLGTTPLDELPQSLSDYSNDHFGLRNTFVHGYNKLYEEVLQMEKGKVSEGLDQWLFLDDNTKDYMGFRKFTDAEIKQITASINGRFKWTQKKEIPFLTYIAPDKINVYGEMLPDITSSPETIRRWEQLQASSPPLSELQIFDLLPALSSAKNEHTLYLKNDTHWNEYGAFVAYKTIINTLKPYLPDIEPAELSAFEEEFHEDSGDLPGLMGRHGDYIFPKVHLKLKNQTFTATNYPVGAPKDWHTWPGNTTPQLYRNPEGSGRMLVFSDSFGEAVMNFLPMHFEETAWFWMYASNKNMEALIDEFKPDVIVEIHLERLIENFRKTEYYLGEK